MKNTSVTQKRGIMITTIIGLVFVIINLLTIKWYPLPHGSDALFTDPVANYILTGHYYDTSWTYGSLYPPLYQITLMGWLKIFGFSHAAVRSLNIFIAFITTIFLFFTLHKYKIIKQKNTLIISVILFWGSNLLSWMAREVRPDMLTFLIVVVLFLSFYYFKKNKSTGLILLTASSIFAPIAGLQLTPFIVFLLIWGWITFQSERKLIFKFSMISLTGIILGAFIMLFYFYQLDLLEAFIQFPLHMSSSLSNILPILPEAISVSNNTMAKASIPLQYKILDAFATNKEYILCMIVNTGVIIYLHIKKIIHPKSIETSLFILALLIPLLMKLGSGRYMYYYSWMGLLISLIFLILVTDKYFKRELNYTFLMLGFIIFLAYPYNFYRNKKNAYPSVSEFIKKQNITESDYVLSCQMAYYDVRIKTANVYFYRYDLFHPGTQISLVAPNRVDQEIKSKINYIIYHPKHNETENNEANYNRANSPEIKAIQKQIIEFKNNGRTVTLIDSLAFPKLYFYKVEEIYSHELAR